MFLIWDQRVLFSVLRIVHFSVANAGVRDSSVLVRTHFVGEHFGAPFGAPTFEGAGIFSSRLGQPPVEVPVAQDWSLAADDPMNCLLSPRRMS